MMSHRRIASLRPHVCRCTFPAQFHACSIVAALLRFTAPTFLFATTILLQSRITSDATALAVLGVYVFLFVGFNAFTGKNDAVAGGINSLLAFMVGFAAKQVCACETPLHPPAAFIVIATQRRSGRVLAHHYSCAAPGS